MWFAIMYWIDTPLYHQPIFTVITILLKSKPEAVLHFSSEERIKVSVYEILFQGKFLVFEILTYESKTAKMEKS